MNTTTPPRAKGATLKVLGSSSKGNCYLLTANNGQTLILDLGIPLKTIKRAINFDLGRVVGAVVTHRHGDHAAHLADAARAGITIHTNADVISHQPEALQPLLIETNLHQWTLIGGAFEILPLRAIHDVECQAFVIRHPDFGKLLFITDSVTLEYQLKGLNHIMIEANYSDELLQQAIESGATHPAMRPRLLASHMELQTTLRALQAQDLSKVQEVILLHLSDGHADPKQFTAAVQRATATPTHTATAGATFQLSNL